MITGPTIVRPGNPVFLGDDADVIDMPADVMTAFIISRVLHINEAHQDPGDKNRRKRRIYTEPAQGKQQNETGEEKRYSFQCARPEALIFGRQKHSAQAAVVVPHKKESRRRADRFNDFRGNYTAVRPIARSRISIHTQRRSVAHYGIGAVIRVGIQLRAAEKARMQSHLHSKRFAVAHIRGYREIRSLRNPVTEK